VKDSTRFKVPFEDRRELWRVRCCREERLVTNYETGTATL
jgi:hypothetical protein